MSSFCGIMKEYTEVALDMFQGAAVMRARAYFLSHCHLDHMVGLDSKPFFERLQSSLLVKLYASEVTCAFLLADPKYKHLEPYLKSLPIEQPISVSIPDDISNKDESLLVTLFPAGHCPGSVMFLFEGAKGNVLYTGDFRLAKGEAARMQLLHSGNRVKEIQSLYLDTTFCVPEALYIPSREQARDALMELVESQIQQSPQHMVRLNCKAKYGYEYLFVELAKEFKMKVHVSKYKMSQYEKVTEITKYLTLDGSTTQIHACRYQDCGMEHASDVVVVTPSTIWFTRSAQPSDILKKRGAKRYGLCFSFHSSFSEVRDFVSHICPVNVYPNVIPYYNSEEDVINRLKDLTLGGTGKANTSPKTTYKPLGQLKKTNRLHRKRQRATSADLDEIDLFGVSSTKSRPSLRVNDTDETASRITDEVLCSGKDNDINNDNVDDIDDDNESWSSHSSGAGRYDSDPGSDLDLFSSSQESAARNTPVPFQKRTTPNHNGNISPECDKSLDAGASSKDNGDKLVSIGKVNRMNTGVRHQQDEDCEIQSSPVESLGGGDDVSSWLKYLPNAHKNGVDSVDGSRVTEQALSAVGHMDKPDSQDTICSQKSEEFEVIEISNNGLDSTDNGRMTELALTASGHVHKPDSQDTLCSSQKSEEFEVIEINNGIDSTDDRVTAQVIPAARHMDDPDSQDTICSSQKSETFSIIEISSREDEPDSSQETTCSLFGTLTESSPTKQVDGEDEPDSQETRCSSGFSIPCTPEGKVLDKESIAQLQEQLADGHTVKLASCKTQLL